MFFGGLGTLREYFLILNIKNMKKILKNLAAGTFAAVGVFVVLYFVSIILDAFGGDDALKGVAAIIYHKTLVIWGCYVAGGVFFWLALRYWQVDFLRKFDFVNAYFAVAMGAGAFIGLITVGSAFRLEHWVYGGIILYLSVFLVGATPFFVKCLRDTFR